MAHRSRHKTRRAGSAVNGSWVQYSLQVDDGSLAHPGLLRNVGSQLCANREIARTGSGRSDDGPIREVMWSNRAEQLRDLTLSVGIDAADCLERVEYVARQCRRYNIDADLEVLRNDSGQAADRHCVWCVGPNQPLWVMHLVLAKIGPSNTHVVLGVARFRRQATGIVAGRAVVGFRQMVQRALTAADEPRRPGNVIDLRSYAALRTSA